MKFVYCFVVLFYSWIQLSQAQSDVKVEATVDSTEMSIGQQAELSISVTHPASIPVKFEKIRNKHLTKGIEVVNEKVENREEGGNNSQQTVRSLKITSFDASLYYIPPMNVWVGGKLYKTPNLAIKVKDIDVDTTRVDRYYGPKDVITPCYTWVEWKNIFLLSLLLIFTVLTETYFGFRFKKNTKVVKQEKKRKTVQPHEWAIAEIEKLKEKFDKENYIVKDYYTDLVDVLRGYLSRRYRLDAMNMTSGEIVETLMTVSDEADRSALMQMLRVADLVKYAKFSTSAGEDQTNLMKVYSFIESSKMILTESELQLEEEDKKKEQQALLNTLKTEKRKKVIYIIILSFLNVSIAIFLIKGIVSLMIY